MNKKPKSAYVCKKCGLAIGHWAKGTGIIWKHFASGSTGASCGQAPIPVLRSEYEARQSEALRKALKRI